MDLIARDITCRRAGRTLFAPRSFEVAAGQALLLRGPNGVGKTTLLRTLAGLLPLASGQIEYGGTALRDLDGVIAYSGHADAIKPALTVVETLDFWADYHGTASRPDPGFGLGVLSARQAGRLSAGQKRRLGLARLPLTGARIWLMDEPTVSLDTDATATLVAMISGHLEGGGIAILATHVDIALPGKTLTLTQSDAPAHDVFAEANFA